MREQGQIVERERVNRCEVYTGVRLVSVPRTLGHGMWMGMSMRRACDLYNVPVLFFPWHSEEHQVESGKASSPSREGKVVDLKLKPVASGSILRRYDSTSSKVTQKRG